MNVPRLPIEIVEADLDNPLHADGVVALIDSYAGQPEGGSTPLSPQVRQRLIPELQKQQNRLILLAMVEGQPAGIAVCFQVFSTFHAKPLINIHDLAVHPDYQRRGIGRRLLEEVERIARERGCCRVTLEVLATNAFARDLYRRFGFAGDDVTGETNFFLKKPL